MRVAHCCDRLANDLGAVVQGIREGGVSPADVTQVDHRPGGRRPKERIAFPCRGRGLPDNLSTGVDVPAYLPTCVDVARVTAEGAEVDHSARLSPRECAVVSAVVGRAVADDGSGVV